MKSQSATAVAAVLVLLVVSSGTGLAIGPGGSLAADFDSSTTDTSTVVVAVGNTTTDEGRASLVAANAIANANDYSVVHVPAGEFPYQLVQTLSQRVKHGDLRHAIVVGVGRNNTDGVATALTAVGAEVGEKTITLDVRDQITGDSASDVLYRSVVQQWDRSDTVFLTTTSKVDTAKTSLALANNTVAGAPVLSSSMRYTDLNATLDDLNASTVYVSPEVSDETHDRLSSDGYTVETAPAGVSLTQTLPRVAAGFAPDKVEDVVVVGEQSQLHAVSQVGAGINSTILVTQSSGQLGNVTKTELSGMTEAQNVYVLGNEEDVDSGVYASIVEAADSNASVDRVTRKHGYTEVYLRTSLLVSGYPHGVLTSHVTAQGGNVTAEITNIGFSTVPEVGGVSVEASWASNAIDSSSPAGRVTDGRYIVAYADAIDPTETHTVTIEPSNDEFENGGHPEMEYYIQTKDGGFVGTSGGTGFFASNLEDTADWLLDFVEPLLPDLETESWSIWLKAVTATGIILIALTVVWAVGRLLRRRTRPRQRLSRTASHSRFRRLKKSRFGASLLGGEFTWVNLLALAIGIGLIVYPEPVTTASGLVLVVATFGLQVFNR